MKKYKFLSSLLVMGIILSLVIIPYVQAKSEIAPIYQELGDKYFFFEESTNINGIGDCGITPVQADGTTYFIYSNPFEVHSITESYLSEDILSIKASELSYTGTAGSGSGNGLIGYSSYSIKNNWEAESDGTLNFEYGDKTIKLAVGETFEDTIDITPQGCTGKLTQTCTVKNYGFIDKSCVTTQNRPKPTQETTSYPKDKYFFFETFTNINGVGDVGSRLSIDFPMYVIRSNPFQVETMQERLELTENTVAVIADGESRTGTAGSGIASCLFASDSYSGKDGGYEWKADSDGTLNFKYEDKWVKIAVGETFEDTKDITPEGRTGTMTQKFTIKNYGFIDKSCVITPNRPTKTPVGDLNGDGQVNAIDLGVITKYLLGKISEIPADDDFWAADLNGDNVINAIDCAYLRKYLLGMISSFPKE